MSSELDLNRIWDTAFAKKVDDSSQKLLGKDSHLLTEAAGKALAGFILNKTRVETPLFFLIGPGNNGLDGIFAINFLLQNGRKKIEAVLIEDAENSSGNYRFLKKLQKKELIFHDSQEDFIQSWNAVKVLNPKRCLIDSVFGQGYKKREKLNKYSLFFKSFTNFGEETTTIAVDIPSGLEANQIEISLQQKETIIPAQYTLTFGGLKPAHILSPIRSLCGEVTVSKLSFPTRAIVEANHSCPALLIDSEKLAKQPLEIERKRGLANIHKFDRGLVLILGGEPGKEGALILAALAALRSGAGWVAVSSPLDPRDASFQPQRPSLPYELTTEELFTDQKINALALKNWIKLRKPQSILIGNGLTHDPLGDDTLEVLSNFAEKEGRVLFDGGAIPRLSNLLDNRSDLVKNPKIQNLLVLPHPGEWMKTSLAPLLPQKVEDFTLILQSLLNSGITVALKTATPLIFSDASPTLVSSCGSNALSRAGTGDLLAGICASLSSATSAPKHCFARSYAILSVAATLAEKTSKYRGITTSDILDFINVENLNID